MIFFLNILWESCFIFPSKIFAKYWYFGENTRKCVSMATDTQGQQNNLSLFSIPNIHLSIFCLLIINSPLCPSLYCMGWNGSAFCISSILLMQVKIGLQIENLSLFSVSLMIPFILGLHSCPGIVISFCWLSEDCKNYWMTPHLHTLTGIMWTRRPVRLT